MCVKMNEWESQKTPQVDFLSVSITGLVFAKCVKTRPMT